jgi:S-DNA-T family DNA segregation ATPase FtsK/SpoIIIE
MANPAPRSSRLAEFAGLLCFALALLVLISLATYSPHDPVPFFKAGAPGPARNFIGPVGAFLAELLIPQLFGAAAVLLPLVLGMAGWKLFWCKPIEAPYTKAAGLALLLVALTAFCSLTFGSVVYDSEAVRAGGAVGEWVAGLLTANFNRAGAHIVIATTLLVALIFATQFSFASLLSSAGALLSARFQALRTALAHYNETRRKEKMRREVIRKHMQKEAGGPALPRVRKVDAANASDEAADDDALADLDFVAPEAFHASAPVQKELPFTALSGLDDGIVSHAKPIAKTKDKSPSAPAPAQAPALGEVEEAAPPRRRRSAPALAPKREPATSGAAPVSSGGLPPTSILDEPKATGGLDKSRLFERAKVLQNKCSEFGVLGSVTQIHPGPVVTTYEFKPDAGIKYSKIVGLADDLALGLEAESIRIDRMSGRSTVAIEIPNELRETIYLREIVESDVFRKSPGRLTLALGKTVSGDTYVTELNTMPHLLIAGSTGTGKSVGLNCMIASLLLKATPDEVRLILIDPKHLELGVYEDIPHLLTPVVTDPKIAANVLKWAVGEMEKRIRKLASEGVRNIDQFNNIIRAERAAGTAGDEDLKPLHYIVIIIDELADLMMVSSNEVEEAITRLAQMARAVGIHLILATQRPSVDVITGLIKANFPSRISFRVAARVDSRTILDSIGAEHLLGKGDMLFLPPGSARLLRIHGAFVTEQEIARLTSYLRKTGAPAYDDSVGKPEKAESSLPADDRDELFDEAVRFVVQSGQASTSMLQRRFRIGFSRAGRLIDMMEQDGIISPADGSKAREILVPADYFAAVDNWPK